MEEECAGPLVSVAMMGYISLRCLWNYSWEFVNSAQPYSPFVVNTSPHILVSGPVIGVPSPVSHWFNSSSWFSARCSILLSLCKQSVWHCSSQMCLFVVLDPVMCRVSDFLIFDCSVVSPHVSDRVHTNSSSSWNLTVPLSAPFS